MNFGRLFFLLGDDPHQPAHHLYVHCTGYILCKVDLPKAIEFAAFALKTKTLRRKKSAG